MHDLNNMLANLAVSWTVAADRLDAEAAEARGEAAEARKASDARHASLTPTQLRSPSYRTSAAGIAAQEAAGFEAKATRAEALAAAERRRADAARSGILLATREDQRSGRLQDRFPDAFREARKAGRIVWEGSATATAPTRNQPDGTAPDPGKLASGTVAGIERRAAATAGDVLTPGVNAK